MSIMVKQLEPWIQDWAPEELVGGMPGRRPDQLHERLMADLAEAKIEGGDLVAIKLDLLKCFDNVLAMQAIGVLGRLGCPGELCSLLETYYKSYTRWIESRGVCAPQCIEPLISILQGCPASCLLLAALTTVWHKAVAEPIRGLRSG